MSFSWESSFISFLPITFFLITLTPTEWLYCLQYLHRGNCFFFVIKFVAEVVSFFPVVSWFIYSFCLFFSWRLFLFSFWFFSFFLKIVLKAIFDPTREFFYFSSSIWNLHFNFSMVSPSGLDESQAVQRYLYPFGNAAMNCVIYMRK